MALVQLEGDPYGPPLQELPHHLAQPWPAAGQHSSNGSRVKLLIEQEHARLHLVLALRVEDALLDDVQ